MTKKEELRLSAIYTSGQLSKCTIRVRHGPSDLEDLRILFWDARVALQRLRGITPVMKSTLLAGKLSIVGTPIGAPDASPRVENSSSRCHFVWTPRVTTQLHGI